LLDSRGVESLYCLNVVALLSGARPRSARSKIDSAILVLTFTMRVWF